MLLYGSYISCSVNLLSVELFHFQVKCTGHIANCQSYLVMADSKKSDHTFINRHSIRSPSTTTAPTPFPPDESQTEEPSAMRMKPTSFQITSVTVQGSRLSTDGGEDSADDLDESHTEDLSSDVLDISRTTDVDVDPLSEENSHSNIIPSRRDRPVDVPAVTSESVVVTTPGNDVPSDPTIKPPTMGDQLQSRFKVVKIVSSQPFKKGRWLCMDFLDPPTLQASEAKQDTPELTSVPLGIETSTGSPSANQPTNNLAHVYEINPNELYHGGVSVTVQPQPVQQPLYGIFLPLSNQQFPDMSSMPAAFAQNQFQHIDVSQQSSTCFGVPTMQPQPNIVSAAQTFAPNSKAYEEIPAQVQTFAPSTQSQVISSVPQTISAPVPPVDVLPMQVNNVPIQVSNVPGQVSNVPIQVSNVPVQVSNLPVQVTNVPVQPSNVAMQASNVSVQVSNVPAQVSNMPVQVNTIPLQQQQLPNIQVPVIAATQGQDPRVSVPISTATQQPINTQSLQTQMPVPITSQVPTNILVPSGTITMPVSSVTTQSSVHPNIPEVGSLSAPVSSEVYAVPSQVPHNHIEALGQTVIEALPEVVAEAAESVAGGGSTVAIDNKIEQAMDLVKSHLMFAVREEVDVLKEKITELMDKITFLEQENNFLRANATQETLNQLNQSQQLYQQQQRELQQQTVSAPIPTPPVQPTTHNQQQQQQPTL